MTESDDHDPFNNPELAHPRARELMTEPFFWDCVDEMAPFGSDEGAESYYEFRNWRLDRPDRPLTECFNWILAGQLEQYNDSLCSDEQVVQDLKNPGAAFMADSYDMFTLDVTIIATALSQLMDEGKIDSSAKPYVQVALTRQKNPAVGFFELPTLIAIERVVGAA
ncbi:MAG: molybdate metabolism regulator [Pseudomonadota bacterium]